ncbi:MAG: nodulation protein NfeD [Desulfarculus sp.]|nr:nodulation protein NfeD [Desulfarculus sp.]
MTQFAQRLAQGAPALGVCLLVWGLVSLALAGEPLQAPPPAGSGPVWVVELKDTVNPGSALYLRRALKEAAQAQAGLAVIQLDTPGGLAESMRQMVSDILAAPLPVAVYVAPSGARAASAGAFLVLAAPIAAMAPATNIGAAHPVGAGGSEIKGPMGDKVTEDLKAYAQSLARQRGRPLELAEQMVTQSKSLEANEALSAGLIDLMASDLASLLGQLEGVTVATAAGQRVISGQGRAIVFQEPSWREKLLSALANPNLAYILLMIGLAGLYFELSTPGAVLPGVVGGLSLLLALFALSALPVSYAGLALIGLAVVLFVAEIKVISHGLLSLGGAAALVLGSLMLFDGPGDLAGVSLLVLLPTVTAVIAFFAGVAYVAGRAQTRRSVTGQEGLIGQPGVMLSPDKARVLGEIWRVKAAGSLEAGQEVVVGRVEGLTLWVEPALPQDRTHSEER